MSKVADEPAPTLSRASRTSSNGESTPTEWPSQSSRFGRRPRHRRAARHQGHRAGQAAHRPDREARIPRAGVQTANGRSPPPTARTVPRDRSHRQVLQEGRSSPGAALGPAADRLRVQRRGRQAVRPDQPRLIGKPLGIFLDGQPMTQPRRSRRAHHGGNGVITRSLHLDRSPNAGRSSSTPARCRFRSPSRRSAPSTRRSAPTRSARASSLARWRCSWSSLFMLMYYRLPGLWPPRAR